MARFWSWCLKGATTKWLCKALKRISRIIGCLDRFWYFDLALFGLFIAVEGFPFIPFGFVPG